MIYLINDKHAQFSRCTAENAQSQSQLILLNGGEIYEISHLLRLRVKHNIT